MRIWEETGKTVVYITHSIEEALLLGDRCVLMTAQPGRIKQIIDIPFPHPRDVIALARVGGVRRAQARHLARARGGSEPRAGGGGAMSAKSRERLLYLISPIALLLVWEILLRLGFGDRRFIPAPSDIAVRFWQLSLNGELLAHTARDRVARESRASSSASVPAIAIGLLMAMSRPVRIVFDPLIAALFPIPKIALMPLVLLAFGFGDASKIARRRARGVLPGDRQHLCGRGEHRPDLLGRGEELRRQPAM